MAILFGHPTGNPNAHHAALAHFEAGQLDSVCLPWMPSGTTLRTLEGMGPLRAGAQRLGRRRFPALADAPKVQGRISEAKRLALRALGWADQSLPNEANEWLMRTMSRECRRLSVSAVHSYEDCSLWQFMDAKRLGKSCIYDMPIGYFASWERIRSALESKYADWLPFRKLRHEVSPEQKRREMELADLVLAPSKFVADSIQEYHPKKRIALAPYGVDVADWPCRTRQTSEEMMTFVYAGQCSVRKGIPLLLRAWQAAGLMRARLQLVGEWQLAEIKKRELPPCCTWTGPLGKQELSRLYRRADALVFPTNFEGFGLVVTEALASGLPVLTTQGRAADEIIDETSGRTVPPDNLDALVEELRWFAQHRDQLPQMSRAARLNAERCTWTQYRGLVTAAVRPLV
jgi:glycosyltransferase involved in cell wall biosynthesis